MAHIFCLGILGLLCRLKRYDSHLKCPSPLANNQTCFCGLDWHLFKSQFFQKVSWVNFGEKVLIVPEVCKWWEKTLPQLILHRLFLIGLRHGTLELYKAISCWQIPVHCLKCQVIHRFFSEPCDTKGRISTWYNCKNSRYWQYFPWSLCKGHCHRKS